MGKGEGGGRGKGEWGGKGDDKDSNADVKPTQLEQQDTINVTVKGVAEEQIKEEEVVKRPSCKDRTGMPKACDTPYCPNMMEQVGGQDQCKVCKFRLYCFTSEQRDQIRRNPCTCQLCQGELCEIREKGNKEKFVKVEKKGEEVTTGPEVKEEQDKKLEKQDMKNNGIKKHDEHMRYKSTDIRDKQYCIKAKNEIEARQKIQERGMFILPEDRFIKYEFSGVNQPDFPSATDGLTFHSKEAGSLFYTPLPYTASFPDPMVPSKTVTWNLARLAKPTKKSDQPLVKYSKYDQESFSQGEQASSNLAPQTQEPNSEDPCTGWKRERKRMNKALRSEPVYLRNTKQKRSSNKKRAKGKKEKTQKEKKTTSKTGKTVTEEKTLKSKTTAWQKKMRAERKRRTKGGKKVDKFPTLDPTAEPISEAEVIKIMQKRKQNKKEGKTKMKRMTEEAESQKGNQEGSQEGSQGGQQEGSQEGCQEGSQEGCQGGSQEGCQGGSHDGGQEKHQEGSQKGPQEESQEGRQDGSQEGSQEGSIEGSHEGSQEGSHVGSQEGNTEWWNEIIMEDGSSEEFFSSFSEEQRKAWGVNITPEVLRLRGGCGSGEGSSDEDGGTPTGGITGGQVNQTNTDTIVTDIIDTIIHNVTKAINTSKKRKRSVSETPPGDSQTTAENSILNENIDELIQGVSSQFGQFGGTSIEGRLFETMNETYFYDSDDFSSTGSNVSSDYDPDGINPKQELIKLDPDYLNSPRLVVKGVYIGEHYQLIARRRQEGTQVHWTLTDKKNQICLNIRGHMEYPYNILARDQQSCFRSSIELLKAPTGYHAVTGSIFTGWKWKGYGYGFSRVFRGDDSSTKHCEISEMVFDDPDNPYHYQGRNCNFTTTCQDGECGVGIWRLELRTYTFDTNAHRMVNTEEAVGFTRVVFFSGEQRIILHYIGEPGEQELDRLSQVSNNALSPENVSSEKLKEHKLIFMTLPPEQQKQIPSHSTPEEPDNGANKCEFLCLRNGGKQLCSMNTATSMLKRAIGEKLCEMQSENPLAKILFKVFSGELDILTELRTELSKIYSTREEYQKEEEFSPIFILEDIVKSLYSGENHLAIENPFKSANIFTEEQEPLMADAYYGPTKCSSCNEIVYNDEWIENRFPNSKTDFSVLDLNQHELIFSDTKIDIEINISKWITDRAPDRITVQCKNTACKTEYDIKIKQSVHCPEFMCIEFDAPQTVNDVTADIHFETVTYHPIAIAHQQSLVPGTGHLWASIKGTGQLEVWKRVEDYCGDIDITLQEYQFTNTGWKIMRLLQQDKCLNENVNIILYKRGASETSQPPPLETLGLDEQIQGQPQSTPVKRGSRTEIPISPFNRVSPILRSQGQHNLSASLRSPSNQGTPSHWPSNQRTPSRSPSNQGTPSHPTQQGGHQSRSNVLECNKCGHKGPYCNHLRNSSECLKWARTESPKKGGDESFIVKCGVCLNECPNPQCPGTDHRELPLACVQWWKNTGWKNMKWRGSSENADSNVITRKLKQYLWNRAHRSQESGNNQNCIKCQYSGALIPHFFDSQVCLNSYINKHMFSIGNVYKDQNELAVFDLGILLNICPYPVCSKDVIEGFTKHAEGPCSHFYKAQGEKLHGWSQSLTPRDIGKKFHNRKSGLKKRTENSRHFGRIRCQEELSDMLTAVCNRCSTLGPLLGDQDHELIPDGDVYWLCSRCLVPNEQPDVVGHQQNMEELGKSRTERDGTLKLIKSTEQRYTFVPAICVGVQTIVDEDFPLPLNTTVLVPQTAKAIDNIGEEAFDGAMEQREELMREANFISGRPLLMSCTTTSSVLYRKLLSDIKAERISMLKSMQRTSKGKIVSRDPNMAEIHVRNPHYETTKNFALNKTCHWSTGYQHNRSSASNARSCVNGQIKTKVRLTLMQDDPYDNPDVRRIGQQLLNSCGDIGKLRTAPVLLNLLQAKVTLIVKHIISCNYNNWDLDVEFSVDSWAVYLHGFLYSEGFEDMNKRLASENIPHREIEEYIISRPSIIPTVSLNTFQIAENYNLSLEEAESVVAMARMHQLGKSQPLSLISMHTPNNGLNVSLGEKNLRDRAVQLSVNYTENMNTEKAILEIANVLVNEGLNSLVMDDMKLTEINSQLEMHMDHPVNMDLIRYHYLIWKTAGNASWTLMRKCGESKVIPYHPKLLLAVNLETFAEICIHGESLQPKEQTLRSEIATLVPDPSAWKEISFLEFVNGTLPPKKYNTVQGPANQVTVPVLTIKDRSLSWRTMRDSDNETGEEVFVNQMNSMYTRTDGDIRKLYEDRPPGVEMMLLGQFISEYWKVKQGENSYVTALNTVNRDTGLGPDSHEIIVGTDRTPAPQCMLLKGDILMKRRSHGKKAIPNLINSPIVDHYVSQLLWTNWRRLELVDGEQIEIETLEQKQSRINIFPMSMFPFVED